MDANPELWPEKMMVVQLFIDVKIYYILIFVTVYECLLDGEWSDYKYTMYMYMIITSTCMLLLQSCNVEYQSLFDGEQAVDNILTACTTVMLMLMFLFLIKPHVARGEKKGGGSLQLKIKEES